jgi:DNA-binding transcriptional MerR regulator
MLHDRVPSSSSEPEEMTIDELARATGVTVRNIRAHQSRGLLLAPQVRGRTGYYTQDHVARLQLIMEMQADGFNLGAIKRILDGMPPGSAGQVLGLERALREPWGEEQPDVVPGTLLAAELDSDRIDSTAVKRAIKMGLANDLGDGTFEVLSPTLTRAGAELTRLGIPITTRLDVQEQLFKHADGVAAVFVKLFLDQIWKPFDDAGQPEEDWPRVREALDRLRPLATGALVATFHLSMSRAVDRAFGKAMLQQAGRRRPSPSRRQAVPEPGLTPAAARSGRARTGKRAKTRS